MRLAILTTVLALSPVAASASGGISCSAEEGGVTFELGGGVARGMGAPLFSFQGTLEIAGTDVAADLGTTEFSREHVAQYWLDGEDLRLLVYRERDGDAPHGYVELTIRTKARPGDDGEGLYDGDYEAVLYDTSDAASAEGRTATFAGKVSCFAE
ncbi:hypothetical protein [Mesorhizobium marinum]|uniref:Uncharacterized protein n=1 Tax=Mesorhizobium marinum TaxID=3228790 RepID=A0ABV3QXH2_9HYPH